MCIERIVPPVYAASPQTITLPRYITCWDCDMPMQHTVSCRFMSLQVYVCPECGNCWSFEPMLLLWELDRRFYHPVGEDTISVEVALGPLALRQLESEEEGA